VPQCTEDPLHFDFRWSKGGNLWPGNGGSDGIHYDVKGNLWDQMFRLGGIIEIDPRGITLGFVPMPSGDLTTTNFAFGGPDNQCIYMEGRLLEPFSAVGCLTPA
jgi:sugar lactone lactonase YvrE